MKFSDYNQFFRLTNNSIYGITVAYDHKYFSVMHVEKIKTYKDFSIRATASYIASRNDKWDVK